MSLKILIPVLLMFFNPSAFAQNLAIKKCTDSLKGGGLPAQWPCEVREIGTDVAYTKEPGPWLIVTTVQYQAFIAAHQSEYDAWVAAHPPATPKPSLLTEDAIKALEVRIKALEVKVGI